MSQNKPLTVFVGLSGGVDSSVAALRLLKQGYKVVGVFIKVWHPDFLDCNWEAERLDAMRVAAHLDIPFLTCDAEEDYKNNVGNYFVSEYLAGRTPNPDVMCNRYIKFGAFWDFARQNGADYIATGHYAQVLEDENGFKMVKGRDKNKDQTYFLWTLTQEDLAHTLFPVGNTEKSVIRQEAEAAGIPTAEKKDSQGICFLGHVDIAEFMSHFTKLEKGNVINVYGEIIGEHKGALIYTLGQRHGFNVFGANSDKPHYVVSKDLTANVVVVDVQPPEIKINSTINLSDINLMRPLQSGNLQAMFRYRGELMGVKLSGDQLTLNTDSEKPAIGQSVVFYQDDICIGGAIVS